MARYIVQAATAAATDDAEKTGNEDKFLVWDATKNEPLRDDGDPPKIKWFDTVSAAEKAAGELNPKEDVDPALRAVLVEKYLREVNDPSQGKVLQKVFLLGLVLLVVVGGVAGWYSAVVFKHTATFAPDAGQKALSALGTLFIIALFVERAQQVYINAWRGFDRVKYVKAVQNLTLMLQLARAKNQTDQVHTLAVNLGDATIALDRFRSQTRKIAFLGGMTLGILISWVGPRILAEVVMFGTPEAPVLLQATHATLFSAVDILITGGLIGGGSEGIHKIVVLITDFLDRTRDRVNTTN